MLNENKTKLTPSKRLKKYATITLIVVFFFAYLFSANTASAELYTSFCLGGWQNPQLAGGKPDLDEGSSGEQFNSENSAVLRNSSANIYCGYFQSSDFSSDPSAVKLRFSWHVQFPQEQPEEIPTEESSLPSLEPEQTLKEDQKGDEPNTETEPAEQSFLNRIVPVAFAQEQEPEEPAEEIPAVEEEMPAEQNKQPAAEQVSVPQNVDYGFAEISYSFNGKDWNFLSYVNANNWQGLSVAVPVTTWEEIHNLQISIRSLTTLDAPPVIYLDGMWIEAEYDQTITEAIQDVGESTLAVLETVLDNAADLLGLSDEPSKDNVAVEEQQNPDVLGEQVDTNEPDSIQQEPPTVKPETEKEKKEVYTYDAAQTGTVPTRRNMPWFSRDDMNKLGRMLDMQTENSSAPEIRILSNGKDLQVSGACELDYFVILVFRQPDDYLKQPNSYVMNHADLCKNSKFSARLVDINRNVAPGNYYLMVAEQKLDTTWVPKSALVPITVGKVVE